MCFIKCPPKDWRQSYRNSSSLCCYNIYVCVRIKQNNGVNDFYILLNCTYIVNAQQTCEGNVEIYYMSDVFEIPETYMYMIPQN